jgi:serine protease Do
MKNLKFGVFCLGLATAVGAAVAGVGAQDPSASLGPGRVEVRRAPTRGQLMMLDGHGPSTLLSAGSQLGVVVSDLDAAQGAGVKIDEVTTDSAAAKAGLKEGDVVVEFDGERVRSARQFTRLVQETADGRTVKIEVLRNGGKHTLEATPEARSFSRDMAPDSDRIRREVERSMGDLPRNFSFRMPDNPGTTEFRMRSSRARLGVSVQELSPELADYFGAKDGGALVSSVTRGSAAEQAGLKAGDVITSVNGDRVTGARALMRELGSATGDVALGVVRDKKEITVGVKGL